MQYCPQLLPLLGGGSTNIAEATYHELMHPLSHLVNAALSTAPAPAGGGDQLTLLKPHTMS